MLSTGVLVVALLLNSFEAPREEKFRGALAPSAELERLIEKRPSYVGPVIAMAAGGTLLIPAAVMWSLGFGASVNGAAGAGILALFGVIVGGAAIATMVVAGVVLIVFAVVRADVDARIRELQQREPGPPPAEPPRVPPAVNAAPASTLLLARF